MGDRLNPALDRVDVDAVDLAGEALQLEIAQLLTTLVAEAPFVAALVDSRQRSLGFLSPQARADQDAAVRAERAAQREATVQGRPLGHGATPTPGNFKGIAVDVDLWATAAHTRRRLIRWHRNSATPQDQMLLPQDPTTKQILDSLRGLIWTCDADRLLREILTDLRKARDAVDALLHGEDRMLLGDCPHCDRPTLVAHFDQGFIRCGKDQGTGHYHACVCPDPLCGCKRTPVTHRHIWWNHRGRNADGWLTLASRIRLDRLAHPTH